MGGDQRQVQFSNNRSRDHRAFLSVTALLALGLMLLLCSSSALALTQRGHVPGTTFGEAGVLGGDFERPSGVAVSEVGATSGDVYVVDRGNNRVERFDSKGKFISAWGYGVSDGASEYEVCVSATKCQAGIPGTGKGREKFHFGKGQLISPEAIAFDNSPTSPSVGDVYVLATLVPEKSFVYKFTGTGEYLGHLTKKEETEEYGRVNGVSVDSTGQVWVAWSGEGHVTHFDNSEKNKVVGEEGYELEFQDNEAARPGFAVDSHDNLFFNFEPNQKFEEPEEETESSNSEEGKGINGEEACEPAFPCFLGKATTAEEGERPIEIGEAFVDGLFGETTRAVAVDLNNDDVYVAHEASISEYTESGALVQRFGTGGELQHARGVAIDSATGTVYVTDATMNSVQVFNLEKAGPPTVDSLSATKITSDTAELTAQVNPTGGATPTVTFEYGPEPCSSSTCISLISSETLTGGEGAFVDQAASVPLGGLAPGVTYHYRVLVHTGSGSFTSGEETFMTRPVTLADNRAWEMVSPAEKNGVGIESLPQEGGVIQASEDGSTLTYIATGPSEGEPEGNRSPAFTQNLAKRVTGSSGPEWKSSEIAIRGPERAPGVSPGNQQEYLFFSPDLREALVEPVGRFQGSEPLLSPEASEKTIYVRHNEECGPIPSTCYVPLVYAANDTAEPKAPFGGLEGVPDKGIRFVGSSTDLKHVVLRSEVPLTNEPTSQESNLYEWTAGKPNASEDLQLVNVLPGGSTAATGVLSLGLGELRRDAISSDGSRVVFTTAEASGSKSHLYSRDMTTRTTTQVDLPQGSPELGTAEAPSYQAASSDGSKIFFTDEQRLTASSTSPDLSGVPDLYVYETGSGKLTDLTKAQSGEAANVQGLMLGTNEAGSIAYFVANGVLTSEESLNHEKATPGACDVVGSELPSATCNLYSVQLDEAGTEWETPKFIARLSQQDLPDWGQKARSDLGEVTDSISSDGHYLAFMSQRPLTGYDNHVTNPQAEGARAEEVFRYDSATGKLICPSCDPSGARPTGVFDTEDAGEGLGLLVDRVKVWENHWLAGSIPGWTQAEGKEAYYQSRYLSDTGRLFFDSADALVPADENGKEDVYEYESPGEGSCADSGGCVGLVSSGTSAQESAFLDASSSGGDAFFLTAAPLVSTDQDTNFDVYDARVCSEDSPCIKASTATTSTCESTASCKAAPPTTAAASEAPATSAQTGTGNLTPSKAVLPTKTVLPVKKPTRAQLLAKALKTCKKLKSKHKRVLCERTAHRRYGTKKASKSKAKKAARR